MRRIGIAVVVLALLVAVGFYATPEPVEAAPTRVVSWEMTKSNIMIRGSNVEYAVTGAGTTEIEAAVSGRVIYAWPMVLKAEGATDITFLTATTSMTGPLEFADGTSLTFSLDDAPYKTESGEAFNVTNSGSVTVNGTFFIVVR